MSSIYKHSTELKGKILNDGDEIYFILPPGNFKYICRQSYLKCVDGHNAFILKALMLINVDRFIVKQYGYYSPKPHTSFENNGVAWPESKYNDFKALTRLTIAILEICESINEKYL